MRLISEYVQQTAIPLNSWLSPFRQMVVPIDTFYVSLAYIHVKSGVLTSSS